MTREQTDPVNRRAFVAQNAKLALGATGAISQLFSSGPSGSAVATATEPVRLDWRPKWLVASCMYGYAPLRDILPELAQLDATEIDLWPKVHGSQREELDALGEEKFVELLEEFNVKLGCLTQYKLGPFDLREEIQIARRLSCPIIVTGAKGPRTQGLDRREVIADFVERMQPEFDLAAEAGVKILIENHGSSILDSVEAIEWFLELCEHPGAGFALAPAHLPQESALVAKLIADCGDNLGLFYAWQFGAGFRTKMDHDREMLQMPGRGELDFGPIVKQLVESEFAGPIEVMMHPTPRGIPIESTVPEVTREIAKSQDYLVDCLKA